MRKYFTKYLPVEGEVQEGGKFLHTKTGLIETAIHVHGPHTHPHKPVKLFLCTSEIQLGDTWYNDWFHPYPKGQVADTNTKVIDANLTVGGDNNEHESFKVIGEVSPDAIWVTEGMEFEESQLIFLASSDGTCWFKTPTKDLSYINPKLKVRIEVLCPTCKTFH